MSWIREPNAEPIQGYRLISPLGSGGFGEVWRCEAPGGIHKAIKFVYGNFNSLDIDCVRAEQEWKALQRIKEVRHPFVCSLDRIEIVEGELVIVMELAERTLHEVYEECVSTGLIGIPRDQLLRYLADAAEALDHLNEKHNLQHLDVKPRNLFIISDRVKVADFGLVKQLERQSSSGLMGGVTPLYAAPETFVGKISQHSDQYSLAIVYQELLTGQRPFAGKNVRQLANQHMQEDPDLRSLPEIERPILARALAKDPSRRFPNCMAFITALYKARVGGRTEAPVNGTVERMLVGAGKVKSETIRDLQLEDYEPSPSSIVDLGAPPPRVDQEGADNLVSDMGMTIPAPDTGALRPTLVIGLGAYGRKALMELRCRFIDRFGDLSKIPILRFLYIDPDPDAANVAVRGTPEVVLSRSEFYPLPLQPVAKYRQRNLDQLAEWLPREKLYAMPRSLQTQGSRVLGRLAFADNQQRLIARLRREVQEITNPDAVYQAVTQTGLALRDNTPRVYVLAAAGGGSSGILPDLGYAMRRLLAHLRHPDAKVHLFLFTGAPQDPATPKAELANLYATLTELNHFSDSTIAFAAQYGLDGQRIVDQGQPYASVYLMTQPHRSPEALQSTLSHLGNYLFHELTTPLGLRLDNMRHEAEFSGRAQAGVLEAPLRSFGTFAVWFPRGLLLRLASRHACRRLIDSWLSERVEDLSAEVRAQVLRTQDRVCHDPDLQAAAMAKVIENVPITGSATEAGQSPGEVLAGMLAKLEDQILQPIAQDDAGNWARQAVGRVRDWIGTVDSEQQDMHDWRKTRLTKTLSQAAQKAAEQWDQKLTREVFGLMENPGARLAAAEVALQQVHSFCLKMAHAQMEGIAQQAQRSVQCWKKVEEALEDCMSAGGGFRWFGGRSKTKQLRNFVEQLALFARQRLQEEIHSAVKHFYALLAGKLAERGRDLGFCRQRLRHLQETLEQGPADPNEDLAATRPGTDYTLTRSPIPSSESLWESIRQSDTARVVLPEQETDLERAALRFLQSMHEQQWVQLDQEINDRLLQSLGGLHAACTGTADLARQLANPLVEETANLLGQHLPIMDVAQILAEEIKTTREVRGDWNEQIRDCLEKARAMIAGKVEQEQHAFLLVPGSVSGKALGEEVAVTFPEIKQVRVAGQADLMFCREQGSITAADLQKLLTASRAAYESLAYSQVTSPHARFDISDWLPIDP